MVRGYTIKKKHVYIAEWNLRTGFVQTRRFYTYKAALMWLVRIRRFWKRKNPSMLRRLIVSEVNVSTGKDKILYWWD